MAKKLRAFSIKQFLVLAGLQYGLLLALLWLGSVVFDYPLNLQASKLVIVFLVGQVATCFFEWFFHRYVLHSMLIPPLQMFTQEHRLHHRLTPMHDYAIVREAQYDAQAFPWWSLSVFYLVFAPGILVAQLIFPNWPILVAGFTATTWSLCFYEVIHNCQHKPVIWWRHLFGLPVIGRAIQNYYILHLMHHKNIRCNEAISGFLCGFPLFDLLLGTYHRPASLSPDGSCHHPQDLRISQPTKIVVWLDNIANLQERRHKKRA